MATDSSRGMSWVGIGHEAGDGTSFRVIVRALEGVTCTAYDHELRLSYLLRNRDNPDEVVGFGCDTFELRWCRGEVDGLEEVDEWLERKRLTDDGDYEFFDAVLQDNVVDLIDEGVRTLPRTPAVLVTVVIDMSYQEPPPPPRLKPASKAAVMALKKVCISGEVCSVCWEELSANTEALGLPCSHAFHRDCIFAWLGKGSTCPICRFQLETS